MNAAISERKPVAEEISGLIERVTFHNSGFCVLRVKTQGHREETNGHRIVRNGGIPGSVRV